MMKRREFIKISSVANAATGFGFTGMYSIDTLKREPVRVGGARLTELQARISGMPPNELCSDHSIIMTRFFKKSAGKPIVLQRAV